MKRARRGGASAVLILLLVFLAVHGVGAQTDPAGRRGKIAFVANLDGQWDLFLMKAEGGHPLRLTDTPIDEEAPSLSPDGTKLVYATSDGQLWIMEPATRRAEGLPLPTGHYYHPRWTPDGKAIVFAAYEFSPGREDADLWIFDFDTKNHRPLLVQTGVQDYPSLSHRGDRLLYTSSVTTSLFGFGSELLQQLWVSVFPEGRVKQLLLTNSRDTQPRWSPDGRLIAFSSDMKGTPHIWTVSADGGKLRRITSGVGADSSPAWSPDGKEIVFVSTRSGRMELWVVGVEQRNPRKLNPFGARPIEAKDPDWR